MRGGANRGVAENRGRGAQMTVGRGRGMGNYRESNRGSYRGNYRRAGRGGRGRRVHLGGNLVATLEYVDPEGECEVAEEAPEIDEELVFQLQQLGMEDEEFMPGPVRPGPDFI